MIWICYDLFFNLKCNLKDLFRIFDHWRQKQLHLRGPLGFVFICGFTLFHWLTVAGGNLAKKASEGENWQLANRDVSNSCFNAYHSWWLEVDAGISMFLLLYPCWSLFFFITAYTSYSFHVCDNIWRNCCLIFWPCDDEMLQIWTIRLNFRTWSLCLRPSLCSSELCVHACVCRWVKDEG